MPGEAFINGQAVPYDPKYHWEWMMNRYSLVEETLTKNLFNNFAYDEEKWADSAISLDNLKSFFRSQVYVEEKWAHNMQLFRAIFPEVQL
ncbi:hypothetical protein QYF36_013703 [Acer negundo]|nr:hypothetical protein QYF36_013703 [Acer negundo]